ncbi:lysine N(6)-hydroxylase/L-ornithine N(5)-oxygenase family protein [Domibacillus iocasae]|uniref:L-lysine N6-monooxygenase MbtG n=1 Tax=Domibacillus iocasae TaxID=1714016 RepID=A0A1E7DL80_9BACI|nr:SidA/IucD/PvdA family monooxygenase [Domibacillus iocasae]OES43830.1 ornithine monooxygenase [Domibacillus iocasae]
MTKQIYDLCGVGIGPFNLGMAALADGTGLTSIFLEKNDSFNWHPGMLINGTDLQVPFLADLVTFADPTSPYTFLNYLHKQNRLYSFFFFQRLDIPRREYNEYAKWVADQLPSCRFDAEVTNVRSHDGLYEITVNENETIYARHVVLGTGSVPMMPPGFHPSEDVIHSNFFLQHKAHLQKGKAITVIGSGQSAAEIFYELLTEKDKHGYKLAWLTRSSGFLQLESAKLGQEVFSPDYVNYFKNLSYEKRKQSLDELEHLRNGVDAATLKAIYDEMYHRSIYGKDEAVLIQPLTEVNGFENGRLHCRQWQEAVTFEFPADRVVLATGYKPHLPEWFHQMKEYIEWEDEHFFRIDDEYRVIFKDSRPNHLFTLTNLEMASGTGATNLGLSVRRNQVILNAIAGKKLFQLDLDTVFQNFSAPFIKEAIFHKKSRG